MMSVFSRRLLAMFGGLALGLGADMVEGVDSEPGLLVMGLGLGAMIAATIRDQ